MMGVIWSRVRQMPRALQWALLAALGTAVYFAYEQLVLDQVLALNERAEHIQTQIERVRSGGELLASLSRGKAPVARYGRIHAPGGDEDGVAALNRAVTDIVDSPEYSISNDTFDLRPGHKLKQGEVPGIAKGGRLEYISGDLAFDTTPEDMIAIIAALESNPDIVSIQDVRIKKTGSGKVKVRLSLESWEIAPAESAKRGS